MGGGVTLGIYAIHQSVITAFLALIDDICEPKTAYIFFIFLLWIAVTVTSYLIYLALKRNHYTSLLFLGK